MNKYHYSWGALLTISVLLIIIGFSISDNTVLVIGWCLFGIQGIFGLYVYYNKTNRSNDKVAQGARNLKRVDPDKVTKADLNDDIEWMQELLKKHNQRIYNIETLLKMPAATPVLSD